MKIKRINIKGLLCGELNKRGQIKICRFPSLQQRKRVNWQRENKNACLECQRRETTVLEGPKKIWIQGSQQWIKIWWSHSDETSCFILPGFLEIFKFLRRQNSQNGHSFHAMSVLTQQRYQVFSCCECFLYFKCFLEINLFLPFSLGETLFNFKLHLQLVEDLVICSLLLLLRSLFCSFFGLVFSIDSCVFS